MTSFFSSTRGTGLPVNLIILLAIGLVALIVMIVIFTGKTKILGDVDACEKQGGQCRETCQSNEYMVPFPCEADKAEAGLNKCCQVRPN
jgi:hypothetical protein